MCIRDSLEACDLDVVEAVGDDLPDVLGLVETGASLVDVGELHGLADPHLAAVGLLLSDHHLEQGGLADAVRADDADDACPGKGEAQVLDQHAVAEALGELAALEHVRAEARARRDVDLCQVDHAVAVGLRRHLLVSGQPGLGLGLTGLGVRTHPVELLREAPSQLGVLLALDLESSRLLLQIRRVVTLVGVGPAAVQLQNPASHVVHEVPVVGHRDDRTRVGREVLLEPQHRLGVQVVGGLIEQEQVGLLQEQLAQRHAATLTPGEDSDIGVRRRAPQGIHGLLQLGVQIPGIRVVDLLLQLAHLRHEGVEVGIRVRHQRGDLVVSVHLGFDYPGAVLDVAQDGLGLIKDRLLHEDADRVPRRQPGIAIGRLVQASHDLEHRGLAGAIGTDDANLGSGVERERDVIEDDLVSVRLPGARHDVNELGHEAKAIDNRASCPNPPAAC